MNELFWLWSDDPVELDERVATEPDDHTVHTVLYSSSLCGNVDDEVPSCA